MRSNSMYDFDQNHNYYGYDKQEQFNFKIRSNSKPTLKYDTNTFKLTPLKKTSSPKMPKFGTLEPKDNQSPTNDF